MDGTVKISIKEVSLSTLFFVGNSIINLPFAIHLESSIFGFLAAAILSLPLLLAYNGSLPFKNKFSAVAFCLYALFCGIAAFRNFVTFCDKIILPEIPLFFPTVLFLGLIWFTLKFKDKVLLKLSLVLWVLSIASVLVLFLMNLNNSSLKLILPKDLPTLKGTAFQSASYMGMSFFEGVILLTFFKDKSKKAALNGFALCCILLFVCLASTLALFGYNLTAMLSYPYAAGMSVISFGDKFSRMEGLSYLLYFSCTLIKTAVCVKTAGKVFTFHFTKAKKYFSPAVFYIFAVVSTLTDVFGGAPFIYVAPFFIIPPLLFTLISKRFRLR